MSSDFSTIDTAGFREDLAAIANNQYPRFALAKLPFNWFAPSTAGVIQSATWDGGGNPNFPTAHLIGVKNGSSILVLTNLNTHGSSAVPGLLITDTFGSTYTHLVTSYGGFAPYSSAQAFIVNNVVGGSVTVTSTLITGDANFWQGLTIIEIGGVSGVSATGNGLGSATATGSQGDLAICFSASDAGAAGVWTDSSGWAEIVDGLKGNHAVQQTAPFGGVSSNATTYSTGNAPTSVVMVMLSLTSGGAAPPAPITPIALPGPCNILSLVSEAIDESGNYFQSALIGEQAAAGFVRFNGSGNIWIPISFASPMTPGYVTTSDNYGSNPIPGTGFNSIAAPFGALDWRPSQPILYSSATPPAVTQYLLAFVGLNLGAGSGIGNGTGNTYAIPSAAGPIDREKKAGLL